MVANGREAIEALGGLKETADEESDDDADKAVSIAQGVEGVTSVRSTMRVRKDSTGKR